MDALQTIQSMDEKLYNDLRLRAMVDSEFKAFLQSVVENEIIFKEFVKKASKGNKGIYELFEHHRTMNSAYKAFIDMFEALEKSEETARRILKTSRSFVGEMEDVNNEVKKNLDNKSINR